MTEDDVRRLLAQYRAGIEAELQLLRQLAEVAAQQRATSDQGDFDAFSAVADARDRIMRGLVTIEDNLRGVRQELTANRELAMTVPGFEEVALRHREAAQLVNEILSTDQQSMSALADAELARRSAVVGLERGETTLAAYRRVLTPPVASARLVDKRG
jgi:hypothetical protein